METNYTLIYALIKKKIPQLIPSSGRVNGLIPIISMFDDPAFVPASPLVFKPGGFWVSFSIDNAYVFKERIGNFLIYQLNFNSDSVYLIQYDIDNRAWVDLGSNQPHEIIIQGSEILLRSDGYPNLATFEDPYIL
jgi:hypothetical protein